MIVGQNLLAETEIICKKGLTGAVLDVQYHVNSSISTPIFHELRVSDSVPIESEISGFESVCGWGSLIFEITLFLFMGMSCFNFL